MFYVFLTKKVPTFAGQHPNNMKKYLFIYETITWFYVRCKGTHFPRTLQVKGQKPCKSLPLFMGLPVIKWEFPRSKVGVYP
jgi:hypothetical protein